MKISCNWLQSFFKKKLPAPEKLAEILTMHSFEVEGVEKTGNDWVLDIDVLPNRAHDCFCHLGVAREIGAVINFKLQIPNYRQIINSKSQVQNLVKIKVEAKDLCPRYTALVIKGVKAGTSPVWLKERIEAIGQKSINNIVDATNYVMFEMGQPLHAFDFDKLEGAEITNSKSQTKGIIIRQAKRGEKITSLDGVKYDLDENVLVIADNESALAIAGIKGGKKAEITQDTENIILEAANFQPTNIRKTSRKLELRTESSLRFEQGIDPNLTFQAIGLAAGLILDLAGGEIASKAVDVYPKKVKPKKIKLDIEKVERLLGVRISIKEIKNILERLDFNLLAGGADKFQVVAPTWRLDVSLPEDLIEEIGRVYGYEKISAQLPSAILIPPKRNESLIYENKVRDILVGIGFTETYNYSFIGDSQLSGSDVDNSRLIEVQNPVSQDQKYLRLNLRLNLLKNIKENLRNLPHRQTIFKEIKLFEIGRVFQKGVEEKKILGGIIATKRPEKFKEIVYGLKGAVDSLLNKLWISDVWYNDDVSSSSLGNDDLLCSVINVGKDHIGWLGEVNLGTSQQRAIAFEIDFEKLIRLATEERVYAPPSKYPAMVRDIAVLVGVKVRVADVLNLINATGGALARDVDLFDMYVGENIPDGKKNFAFHIIYQADDRTLTDKEVNGIHNKIIETLEKEGGWEVRK